MKYLIIILFLPLFTSAQRIEAENLAGSLGVGTYPCSDGPGCQCVGSIDNGDRMSYSITPGLYRLFFRVASPNTGAKFQINGRSVNIPNTGNWQAWKTINDTFTVAGVFEIRSTGAGWNLNYIDVRQWWDVNGDSTSILLPPSKDTIFTTEIDYWNGSVRAKKSVKWVRVVRMPTGKIDWYDNTGVKVDAIMYRNGYGNWVNL